MHCATAKKICTDGAATANAALLMRVRTTLKGLVDQCTITSSRQAWLGFVSGRRLYG